jgi:hypothetical protein
MAENFSYKIVEENKLLSFDFSQALASSETIATANCSILVMDGTDPFPFSVLAGSSVISGTTVIQRVQGGLNGVTYRLVATITTSMGNTLVALGDLPVYTASAIE